MPRSWSGRAGAKKRDFAVIYPGHGLETTMDEFDADAAYIQDAVEIMDMSATPDEAKAAIRATYPAYQSEFLLGLSVDMYFASCKPQP
jgi:hypothetical protein